VGVEAVVEEAGAVGLVGPTAAMWAALCVLLQAAASTAQAATSAPAA
jgi:hypothetical protein